MKSTPDIESKKKREQFMIEIRKNQNDIVFRARRTKFDAEQSTDRKSLNLLDKEIEQEALEKFQEYEREMINALATNNSEEVFTILNNIRCVLNSFADPNLVPWAAFFKTNLFDLLSVNLRQKKYYNEIEIKKETLWWAK